MQDYYVNRIIAVIILVVLGVVLSRVSSQIVHIIRKVFRWMRRGKD